MARGTAVVSEHVETVPLTFSLFGGLRVELGGKVLDLGPPKQRAVLAMLALEARRVVPTERFVELLFDHEGGALTSLQAYISRLRRVLEPGRDARTASVLLTQRPGYRLEVPSGQIDVERFDDLVREARMLTDGGDIGSGIELLRTAIVVGEPPLLPEFADLAFVIEASRRIEQARLAAVDVLGALELDGGNSGSVVSLVQPVSAAHPERERAAWLLARALYAERRQADALAAIARCRRALRERSGLEPGPDLVQLERDILEHASHLAPPAPPTVASEHADGPARTNDLVGRSRELAAITRLLDDAAAGRGGAIVLLGEPGIGKSALAEAAATHATGRGWDAIWVRCAEHRESTPRWLGLVEGGSSDDITLTDRNRLFAAIVETRRAAEAPTLLVVDDIQWADPDSLRLLQYLSVDLPGLPLAIVVTSRPLAGDASPTLLDALVELGRVRGAQQLALEPFSVDDVSELLDRRPSVVAQGVPGLIHDRTGGNPLFVREVIEMLDADGGLADEDVARAHRTIPPAVQLVVRRRVSQLDPSTQRMLSIVAVLGGGCSCAVVADVAGCTLDQALTALAPAFEAGLLAGSLSEPSFSHGLVADALAAEVNDARSAGMHAEAARAMATLAGDALGLDAAAVAHHAYAGILAGTGDLAIEAGRRAAERASSWSAHEESAAHWARVADASRRVRPSDVSTRVRALIEQARSLVRVDMERDAKGPILEAIRAADQVGDVDSMAEAAALLAHANVWTIERYGDVNDELVVALERTISMLPEDDPRQVRLLGALPAELVFAAPERHARACRRSLEAARRHGDPTLLALALNGTMLPKRPSELDPRAEAADEMLAIAAAHPLPAELEYAAHHHAGEVDLERGDLAAAERHLAAGRAALADGAGVRQQSQYLWFAATLANATGRYREATRLGDEAFALHRRRRQYDADVLMLSGRVAFTIDQGGFESLLEMVAANVDVGAYQRSTAEILALGALEAGLVDRASALIDGIATDAAFPDDFMRLCCATAALHVRVELGRRDEAAAAAAVLDGYEDRWAGGGTSPVSAGFGSLALARLAAADANVVAAHAWFARAGDSARRAGTPAWLARTHLWHGQFLAGIGDATAARRAFEQAAALADRHRLIYVHRRLGELTV